MCVQEDRAVAPGRKPAEAARPGPGHELAAQKAARVSSPTLNKLGIQLSFCDFRIDCSYKSSGFQPWPRARGAEGPLNSP